MSSAPAGRKPPAPLPAHFVAFDLLRLSGTDTTSWPYRRRRAALQSVFAARRLIAPWTLCPSTTEADVVHEWLTWASVGMEGVVFKRLDGVYEPSVMRLMIYRGAGLVRPSPGIACCVAAHGRGGCTRLAVRQNSASLLGTNPTLTSRGRGWTRYGRTVVRAMVWFQWSGRPRREIRVIHRPERDRPFLRTLLPKSITRGCAGCGTAWWWRSSRWRSWRSCRTTRPGAGARGGRADGSAGLARCP
ncbi:ATP-dependent DNA ligase ligC [Streptomyces sp. NL15-2K]|nr:ATP-dependent DNA ligase ligC [Streptomyces sp. NL15-2K]